MGAKQRWPSGFIFWVPKSRILEFLGFSRKIQTKIDCPKIPKNLKQILQNYSCFKIDKPNQKPTNHNHLCQKGVKKYQVIQTIFFQNFYHVKESSFMLTLVSGKLLQQLRDSKWSQKLKKIIVALL